MVKLSRREFVAATSALLFATSLGESQESVAASPARPARQDCFFGLHFDLHPNLEDTELGQDLTEEMVSHLLESCRPDFIQYDSKGHPGYLGFPSRTGMSAPGIVKDSLAIWRRVTAARGIALYNHFSGVLDGLAVARHPEWARIGPDGKLDLQETSLFSAYERELMIPELSEVALKYDLDGSWVDGDCWAVRPDYSDAAQQKFLEKTGIALLPKKHGDPGWNEFLELQREQFRQYVAHYADALHRAKPNYQITSNWMYSTYAPERPVLALDYLSGDIADHAAVRQARSEARYLASCGKTWDLMSWGFESGEQFSIASHKPAVELEQEAAIVLAQGGAYQIYYVPTRAGWIDERIVKTAAEVGKFCRERQRWSHHSKSLPEVGVLFSGRTLYCTAGKPFGEWGAAEAPGQGAVELLLSCGYSVDLIPDWQAAESAAKYPLIVVPDWKDIGAETATILANYAAGGGKLLLCGAENVELFASVLNLRFMGPSHELEYYVADESGFAEVKGNWIEIDARPREIAATAYRNTDTRKGLFPLAVRAKHGKGTVIACGAPMCSAYRNTGTPIIRSVVRGIVTELQKPTVNLDGDYPGVEVVHREKDGQMLIHFINTNGAPVNGEFRHSGIVPCTVPIGIRIRLPRAPSAVVLEPEGKALAGKYEAGEWSGVLPALHIHSILRIS